MLTDLKPCPFCGMQPEDPDVGDYFVECPRCGVQGPVSNEDGRPIAKAEWNRRAIETKVIAEEQEPVARVREHDDYQATIDWLLNPLPDCTVLFDSQQPPAPCPKCAELELKVKSIRSETLAKEEQTADGFWSLYQTEKAANKILQAKAAEQSAEISELRNRLSQKMDDCVKAERKQESDAEKYWQAREMLVARTQQQSERIAELERQVDDLEAELDDAEVPIWPEWAEQCLKIVRKHSEYDGFDDADGIDLPEELRELLAEYDTEFDRERAKLVAANGRITEQAAMIEKCEKALARHVPHESFRAFKEGGRWFIHRGDDICEVSEQAIELDALAAIAAQKGGA